MTEIIRIKCGTVNCYLLKGEHGSVLIDTALPKFKDKIIGAVRDADLKLILLTHGHADHIGGAQILSDALGVPIAMNPLDSDLIQNQHSRKICADTLIGRFLKSGTEQSRYKPHKFIPDVKLNGGEKLNEYGVDAQCAALPGHTAGSIGVLVNKKDFIVGDAFFNIFKPKRALIYENSEDVNTSLELIRMSRCETIYPGHGNPFAASDYFAD